MSETTSGLTQTIALHRASQSRLIATVRALRGELSEGSISVGPVTLPVAPLGVPDRITKRDYNYFNALNAALEDLAHGRRRTSEGQGPDLT